MKNKRFKSKAAFLILIVIVLLATTGFFLLNGNVFFKEARSKRFPVTIGIQDSTITSLVLVARDLGYFKEQGLDVTIKKYPSGKLAFLGMLDGEVDLATTSEMPVMVQSLKRNDFRVIATIATTNRGVWVIARKDKGISGPNDLVGKRIGTQKGSAVHFFLSMFLLSNMIEEKDVEIDFINAVDLPRALTEGRIDAFSMRDPFISAARESLHENAVELFDYEAYMQFFNMVAPLEYIKEHEGVINKLLRGLIMAEESIKTDAAQSMAASARVLGPEREKEISNAWKKFSFHVSLPQNLLLTLENEADWAITNNLAPEKEIPNYLEFIYFKGLDSVKPELITMAR